MHNTKDGLKYFVRHERVDGEPPPLVSQTGGRTVVTLCDETGETIIFSNGDPITGTAYCRPDEMFNRKLGRTIALGKALKAYATGEPQPLPWWRDALEF